jgi:hypothetical protein
MRKCRKGVEFRPYESIKVYQQIKNSEKKLVLKNGKEVLRKLQTVDFKEPLVDIIDWTKRDTHPMIFIGPTVEGHDTEYIKIISGKLSNRKPSFLR